MVFRLNSRNITCSPYYVTGFDILLAHNDVLSFLQTVPSKQAQLVVSSPPYNIGKPYEQKKEFKEYLEWQRKVLVECARILRGEGSLCWEVGNYVDSREVYPLDLFFYQILKEELGLRLRNRIIWTFEHGLHASKRFSGRYEVILWFTKGESYVLNLDPVRVPSKYPGKRHYKGPHKGEPSCNPKGKNPGDAWRLKQEWEEEIWNIPNVKSNHPEKTIHPSQFPIELIERLVLALTHEGDLVLDPFMGVGSTLIAGLIHNRRVMGVDYVETYVNLAYQRIQQAINGTLKKRLLGRDVYKPTGKEKVARLPVEWKEG